MIINEAKVRFEAASFVLLVVELKIVHLGGSERRPSEFCSKELFPELVEVGGSLINVRNIVVFVQASFVWLSSLHQHHFQVWIFLPNLVPLRLQHLHFGVMPKF